MPFLTVLEESPYIKLVTLHFSLRLSTDRVSKGIMNVGIQTNVPVTFGVLTCLNDDQVKARSSEGNNHGYDWGKTAVEMAILKSEALGAGGTKMSGMGFSSITSDNGEEGKEEKKEGKGPGFF